MIRREKQRLRKKMRAILKDLPPGSRISASAKLRSRLSSWPVWQAAAAVCAFCALPGEPELLAPWPEEKSVLLPLVAGDSLSMRQVESLHELSPGSFGILEPPADAPAPPGGWDLILIPGLAFDRNGGRLGRGRGYYDRFLSLHHGILRVGVCFDEQLVPSVPCEAHDLRLHALITPSETLTFALPNFG